MDESTKKWLATAVIVVLALGAYVNTIPGEWVWDDVSSVVLHKHVQDPRQFFQLFKEDQHAFGRGQGNFYRPLLSASFMLDCILSRGSMTAEPVADGKPAEIPTFYFHVTSLLWHMAAAVLLLWLLLRVKAPIPAAGMAAAIYAVHPLHTEAVAYISGRADMMSAAFMYAGLLAIVASSGRWGGIVGGVLGLACFGAGLLSKESSLIFPVLLGILLTLLWMQEPKGDGPSGYRLVKHFWPAGGALLLLIGYMALRSSVLKFAEGSDSAAAPLGQRLMEAGQAFTFYHKLLFWPTHLHMERTLKDVPSWIGILGWGLIILWGMGAVLAVRFRQYRIAAGMVWFLAGWLPISGIFPLNAPMAEHWMYVPMAGFWWVLAEILVMCLPKSFAWAPVVPASVFCLLLLGMTVQRNLDWHDNVRLFRATLQENPDSIRVHYNLAVTYEELEKNWAGARRHYEAVLHLQGQDGTVLVETGAKIYVPESEVRLSLGRVLEAQQDMAGALTQYQKMMQTGANADEASVQEAIFGGVRCLLAMGEWPTAESFHQRVASQNAAMGKVIASWINGEPLGALY